MTTQETPSQEVASPRSFVKRRWPRRWAARCMIALGAVSAFGIIGIGALFLRIAVGPLSLSYYSEAIESGLAARLGPGWRVDVADMSVELTGFNPAVRLNGLEIRNPLDAPVVRAPSAVVSFSPLALLTGVLSPRDIELRGLQVRGVIGSDGSLLFSAPADAPVVPAPALPAGDVSGVIPSASEVADGAGPSVVSAAASSLVRPLVSPSGIIGPLDRAKVVDARLTLFGPDGSERATFDGVDALFEKVEGGDRRFEFDLRGPRGAWHASGRVDGARGHATSLEAHGVPIADVMLLTGLSKAPVSSDIKLSGTLNASFGRDRLSTLAARIRGSRGSIERPWAPPIPFDGSWADLSWDETERALSISRLGALSEGTEGEFEGKLSARPGGAWTFAAKGRDITVADLDPGRPRFRLSSVDVAARFEDGRLALDRLVAKGDQVDATVSALYSPGSSDQVLTHQMEVTSTDARKLVRLWPDMLNSSLRSFLAKTLTGGVVERLGLKTSFDQSDLAAAMSGHAISSKAVDLSLAARGTGFSIIDGLPPLKDFSIQAQANGTSANITATAGAIEMPDGRRINVANASFVHGNLDKTDVPGQLGVRLRGGFDALASLLRMPLLREAGAPDLDPKSVRGNVDLKVGLPIVLGAVTDPARVPVEISGTLSDVAVDKLPGRERLEAGQFNVQHEKGALSVKGEARLSGSPASFDLRVPKGSAGDLVITTTLDEAARTRRGLPVAPALTGPVGVKVMVALSQKTPPKVEADLTRASIDGLVPGWQKAAGRPGRIAFTINEGASTDLRDLVVDSGPVQIRGSAVLSAAGGLERAELSSLRLSPGDDMRAQIDHAGSGYRVNIRGNNADSRPLQKLLNAAAKPGGKDGHDTELDLALAIVSGFNDEAMTGVTAKASVKGGELRALQFGGKFRSAAIEASLAKRDAGAPVLVLRSGDAGATLRFLDLYRRMNGGRMDLEARVSEATHQGQVTIEEFGLKGEPALRRIVAQSQQSAATDERGAMSTSRQDVDQVLFNRMRTVFRRSGSRVDFSDAVIYGPQVGFNLSGWIDNTRDRLDITGTFVPAYVLNNAFSQLPVVGMILGGGRTEGLIALEFRVAGALSSPAVTVNPLTAVAPGILRKLFGWVMNDGQRGQSDNSAAGSVPPPPAARRTR